MLLLKLPLTVVVVVAGVVVAVVEFVAVAVEAVVGVTSTRLRSQEPQINIVLEKIIILFRNFCLTNWIKLGLKRLRNNDVFNVIELES